MNLRIAQFRLLVALAAFVAVFVATSYAANRCCDIIAVNNQTGIVTAKVNDTGQSFQFRLNDNSQLKNLNVGESIYANLVAKQVSLDGKNVAGTITSVAERGAVGLGPESGKNGEILASSLRQVTLASDPADPSRKTAIVSLTYDAATASKIGKNLSVGVNGHGVELKDADHNGTFTGRVRLAEPFPTRDALRFNVKSQTLNPEKASVSVTIAGHVVPCPANCNSTLGNLFGFKDPCVLCIQFTKITITGSL
ncbi:MAG: hypothetical protein ACJ71Q_13865 [Terriglobales bacterium]